MSRSPDTSCLDVTVDQWQAALAGAQQDDPGLTASELAFNHGLPASTVRSRLEGLVRAGKCQKGQATRVDSAGRKYHVSVYQLSENK